MNFDETHTYKVEVSCDVECKSLNCAFSYGVILAHSVNYAIRMSQLENDVK